VKENHPDRQPLYLFSDRFKNGGVVGIGLYSSDANGCTLQIDIILEFVQHLIDNRRSTSCVERCKAFYSAHNTAEHKARQREGVRTEIGKDTDLQQKFRKYKKDFAEKENLDQVDLIADAPHNMTTPELGDLLWSQLLDENPVNKRKKPQTIVQAAAMQSKMYAIGCRGQILRGIRMSHFCNLYHESLGPSGEEYSICAANRGKMNKVGRREFFAWVIGFPSLTQLRLMECAFSFELRF
jgi:hypothetical protein